MKALTTLTLLLAPLLLVAGRHGEAVSMGASPLTTTRATQGEGVEYPTIVLCGASESSPAPLLSCNFRAGKRFGPFEGCNDTLSKPFAAVNVDSQQKDSRTKVNCVAVNSMILGQNSKGLRALDGFSMVTLQTLNGLSVSHAYLLPFALASAEKLKDLNLDVYTDLIYLYESSGLITVGEDTVDASGQNPTYSMDLHTHYRPSPSPQYIWVRIDPQLFATRT